MGNKNKNILIVSILGGIVISLIGSFLSYLAGQLGNKIIFKIPFFFLSFSYFLLITLGWYIEQYIWEGFFNSTFNVALFTLLISFIVWTLFIYFVCKLY